MVLQNIEAIANAVKARFDSFDKILIEFAQFTIMAVVIFRVLGSVVDVHSLILGVPKVSHMLNKAAIQSQTVAQGLTEFTQTGQQSKQGFLNSPYPDLGSISGQHESELRRANARYLNSSASAEGMQGTKVREFASDRKYVPSLSGGLSQAVSENILPLIAAGN
jgi:hypothetical protein